MIDQAVILCGGLGERLRPLTDSVAKPMVDIAGRPFLAMLLEQLGEAGLSRFVLCSGYRRDQISSYFGDGSSLGYEILYSEGPTEWPTGRRLLEARHLLSERFVLMYSDNFAAVDVHSLLARHIETGSSVTLSISPKPGGNVLVDGDRVLYQRYRSERMTHVEIGYMLVERDSVLSVLDHHPAAPDVDFADVLVTLESTRSLGQLEVHGGYWSISDPIRLEEAREFLGPNRVLLVDRDGTINERPPRGRYVSRWEDFQFIDESVEAMRRLAEDGFRFVVITNQAGVALGLVEQQELDRIHKSMTAELSKSGIMVDGVFVSPHHWDEDSFDRKPQPGLFFRASRALRFRLDRSVYVGDDIRDCEAAANARCGMVFLDEGASDVDLPKSPMPQWVVGNFGQAVPIIKDFYERQWQR